MAVRPTKAFDEGVTLVASAAVTATSTGTTPVRIPVCPAIVFVLDATVAATSSGDILAAFVQTKVLGNWIDVVAFTTVLGDGGAKRHIAKVAAGLAEAMFENASALAAGSVRHIHGDEWRARWTVTDATTDDASFTFSLTACPM